MKAFDIFFNIFRLFVVVNNNNKFDCMYGLSHIIEDKKRNARKCEKSLKLPSFFVFTTFSNKTCNHSWQVSFEKAISCCIYRKCLGVDSYVNIDDVTSIKNFYSCGLQHESNSQSLESEVFPFAQMRHWY